MLRYLLLSLLIQGTICIHSQEDTTRFFAFGHSLVNHTTSDETTIPHWIFKLAEESGHPFAAGGKYGFLPQHRILPPFSQWGYLEVPPVWDSDNETFAEADLTTIFLTAANFIQDVPPTMEYYSDPGITPISATEDIIQWISQQEDSLDIFIYENWPDMAGYLSDGFPADSMEFAAYNAYTLGAFHDWWIIYHDSLRNTFPDVFVRMIPVGPIMADLFTKTGLRNIQVADLYEDDAPHGQPTVYFLAGLISYMAIFEEPAPKSFIPPSSIHNIVSNNYEMVVDFIWSELLNFNDDNGDSRVFAEMITQAIDWEIGDDHITLYPNPNTGIFNISGDIENYLIQITDNTGHVLRTIDSSDNNTTIDISDLPGGIYFIRARHTLHANLYFEKILKQ